MSSNRSPSVRATGRSARLALLFIALLIAPVLTAQAPVGLPEDLPSKFEIDGGVQVELLTAEEAKQAIIDETDPFFAKLTHLEMSLRLDEDVMELPREEALAKYRAFLQENVTDWKPIELAKLRIALPQIAREARKLTPNLLPKKWRFIRTTGREESGAPYTRGDCIVLPEMLVASLVTQDQGTFEKLVVRDLAKLGRLLIHEMFHIYTRNHPAARDELYAAIGFKPIPAVTLPRDIDAIRLTNPDGPGWEHAITVKHPHEEKSTRAILLLTSKAPKFQPGYMGVLPVLSFHLYPITDGDNPTLVRHEAGHIVRWNPNAVPNFAEQVGRNTGYIIHPDEILADNAAMLVYPQFPPRNPELILRVKELLSQPLTEKSSTGTGKPRPASHDEKQP